MKDFVSRNFGWLIAFVAFIIFMFSDAGQGCRSRFNQKPDTVRVETKTEYIPQPPVFIPQYVPVQSGTTQVPVVIPPNYQPSQDLAKLTEQYNQLVKEFLSVKTYKDSITLKDTAGQRVGVVNLEDVISENEFKSRAPSYQLTFPHTTTTITLREPPRTQLFLGGGLTAPVMGANIGAALKNKKESMFQLNAGAFSLNGEVRPYFGLSYYKLLKLR
jgi:hypothetical protein